MASKIGLALSWWSDQSLDVQIHRGLVGGLFFYISEAQQIDKSSHHDLSVALSDKLGHAKSQGPFYF